MKYSITLPMLLLFLGCSTYNSFDEQSLLSEAETFSFEVIQTYFDNDPTTYESFLGTIIYFLEAHEEPVSSSEINVNSLFSGFDYSSYTLQDYKDSYHYKVYTHSEYSEQSWYNDLQHWEPDKEDYFFLGTEVKEGHEEFMWDDLLFLIVSKRTGEWKIRALWG